MEEEEEKGARPETERERERGRDTSGRGPKRHSNASEIGVRVWRGGGGRSSVDPQPLAD